MTDRRTHPLVIVAVALAAGGSFGCGMDWTVPDPPEEGGAGGAPGTGASSATGAKGGAGGGPGGSGACLDGDATCCEDDPNCSAECADANGNDCPVPCEQDPSQPQCLQCDVFGDCGQCADCAFQGPCADPYANCYQDQECALFLECMMSCGGDPNCAPQCYDMFPNGVAGAQELAYCIGDVCPVSCQGQSFGL